MLRLFQIGIVLERSDARNRLTSLEIEFSASSFSLLPPRAGVAE
jgi:hypothetical protein